MSAALEAGLASAAPDLVDGFARENLPPRELWPDFLLDRPEFRYPAQMNCVAELLDRWAASGQGGRACLRSGDEAWSYAELGERVNRIAEVLTRRFGLVPGGRVLLRAPNTPMMVAAYLAVIKAGGIAVATMPLLRARELAYMIGKARIGVALCDHRLLDELRAAQAMQPGLRAVVAMGGEGGDDLVALMRQRDGTVRRLSEPERRCVPDRLHVGLDGRTEGHDALPPRHAGGLRRVWAARAAGAAG